MGKTKKNRNAKQGIDTMGVSTSEIAKEISKPQTAMPIYESNDDDTDWQTMLWEVTKMPENCMTVSRHSVCPIPKTRCHRRGCRNNI